MKKGKKMKFRLLLSLLFLTASVNMQAQVNGHKKILMDPQEPVTKTEKADEKGASDSANKTQSVRQPYVRPDAKTRFNRYVKSVVGPTSLAKNVFTAGLNTATDSPEEWGPKWEGFGRRLASDFGKSAIKNTTVYALDEAFELDSRFYPSQKKDFGSRLKNALISPVTARNKNGQRVIGIPRLAGTYSSSIIAAETWFPKRFGYKDGLRSGTISLGTTALFNVFKEFIFKK